MLTAAHPCAQAAAALVWKCPELTRVLKTHGDADSLASFPSRQIPEPEALSQQDICHVNNDSSAFTVLNDTVPQGSVLGPIQLSLSLLHMGNIFGKMDEVQTKLALI